MPTRKTWLQVALKGELSSARPQAKAKDEREVHPRIVRLLECGASAPLFLAARHGGQAAGKQKPKAKEWGPESRFGG